MGNKSHKRTAHGEVLLHLWELAQLMETSKPAPLSWSPSFAKKSPSALSPGARNDAMRPVRRRPTFAQLKHVGAPKGQLDASNANRQLPTILVENSLGAVDPLVKRKYEGNPKS